MSTHAIDLDHIERYLALDPKTRHGISDATALELVTALRRERETVTRYERFLRALTATDSRAALLDKTDLGEWAEEQAQTLLDGGEAECPNCCTPLHEGACVSEDGGTDAN